MSATCPRCHTPVAVRLAEGEVCPDCRSATAWERYASGGKKLVIDRPAITEAEQRRAGEAAGESAWVRTRRVLPAVLAALAGAAGVVLTVRLLSPAALQPLADVLGQYRSLAVAATLLGAAALLGGVFAVFVLRRSRLFRSWPALAFALASILAGAGCLGVGGLHWYAAASGFRDIHGAPWRHTAMPGLGAATSPVSPLVRSIMEATTVVLAPDEEGDMRGMAIGSGSVISRSAARAWVLTNSHVAMPYASTSAFREPGDALPVLVYFSDGRHAAGRVVWVSPPPLDAVVLSVELPGAPPPIRISPDAEAAGEGAEVLFVPNPFRRGWTSHLGRVLVRREKMWPAGVFSLIYTDLPLEPGDSGSGLFDGRGRLIGINTWGQMDEDRGTGRLRMQGISLPAKAVQEIMELVRSDALESLETPR